MVALKNCQPELSYLIVELFNKCLKESCFPDCLKALLVVPVFKNVWERSTAKNYHPINLLSVVSKAIKRNAAFFSDFQNGFRSCQSTVDLLALDISKAFDMVWHDGLLHKLMVDVRYLILSLPYSVTDSFELFLMGSIQNNIQ